MPFKNTEERREHMRKVRGNTMEGTQDIEEAANASLEQTGSIHVLTREEAEREEHPGAAPGYKVLSDGQLWYPGNNGYHPTGCNCGIEHKAKPAC